MGTILGSSLTSLWFESVLFLLSAHLNRTERNKQGDKQRGFQCLSSDRKPSPPDMIPTRKDGGLLKGPVTGASEKAKCARILSYWAMVSTKSQNRMLPCEVSVRFTSRWSLGFTGRAILSVWSQFENRQKCFAPYGLNFHNSDNNILKSEADVIYPIMDLSRT